MSAAQRISGETWMPSAFGAAQTARVSGSGRRPSPSMRSLRRNAARTTIPPAQASGSGGTGGDVAGGQLDLGRLAGRAGGEDPAGEVRRADAVAGEAEGVVDRHAVERADLREVGRRDVDRAAPGVRDRAAGDGREQLVEVAAGLAATSGSTSTRPCRRAPAASRPPPQPNTIRPSFVVRK